MVLYLLHRDCCALGDLHECVMPCRAFHGVLLVQHKPLPVRDSWPHKWHSHLHWKRFAPATKAHLTSLCGCLTCMPHRALVVEAL